MRLFNALFFEKAQEVLFLVLLWMLCSLYITTEIYYLGVQWKNLGFIYCPNESFLEKAGPFVEF
jgi:hypothetical protein